MIKKTLSTALIILLILSTTQAWNGRGHMIIASITYSKMSQEDRDSTLALLKYHPDYENKWLPGYNSWENDVDFGTYIFMKASIWADEIKWRGNPNHRLSKSNWHYITYKIQFPDNHDTSIIGSKKEPNVVWAIENAQKIINDKSQKLKKRAIALSWLLHLIGDIHQPIHCASTFNDTYPEGDLGGNRIYFDSGKSYINLHSLWDNALGKSKQYKPIVEYANKLMSNNADIEIKQKNNVRNWSLESFNKAIKDVHLNGKLQGSDDKETEIKLPENYVKNMKKIAEKQFVIAAIRTKYTINELKFGKEIMQ